MSRDALVVGINQCRYEGLHNLKAPAEDAEAIARILETYGDFNVWRLPEAIQSETRTTIIGTNLEVYLKELQKALVRLFKPEGNQIPDTALFYFSGHGYRQDLGIQEGFCVPVMFVLIWVLMVYPCNGCGVCSKKVRSVNKLSG